MTTAPLDYAGPSTRAPGPIARFLLSPVGWPLGGAAVLVTMLAACAWSGPAPYLRPAVYSVDGGVGVAIVWVFRLMSRSVVAGHFGRHLRWSPGRWAFVPAALLMGVALVAADVPAAVAFRLARPGMERAARAALASPTVTPGSVRIACYGAVTPRVIGSSVYFTVGGHGLWREDYGYAFRPSGPPRYPLRPSHLNDDAYCRHIDGPWYAWCGGY